MIELTEEQRRELANPEPVAIDPQTKETYVLLPREAYERLKALLAEDIVYTTAEILDEVMAEDDAGDPLLGSYQH